MSRAWLRVSADPVNAVAYVAGPGAGKLIEQAGGTLMWSARRKAWATSVRIAVDVLAQADHEGRLVTYSTEDAA